MITICNLRTEKPTHPWDVQVTRPSVLGNPYFLNHESQRDTVCNNYVKWLSDVVKSKSLSEVENKELGRIMNIYRRYGKLRLFCWCAPKRCHAETIRDYIQE